MASRELNILITAKNLASGVLRGVRGDVRSLSGAAGLAARNAAVNLGRLGVVGGAIVATQVRAGLESLAELERLGAQTTAVIKSTGGAAGISAEQVRGYAEELENLTTVDDKAIQNAENLLLTFTNVREDAFKPALEAIIDLNAALGGDDESLQGVAIQVGKALNDPVRGLTALRRMGVSFTAQQQKQIKALVEENRLFEAQQIILGELSTEFGGSAAAQADTYAGKMRRLEDAVEDAQKAIAIAFLPVIEKASVKLAEFLSDPDTLQGLEDFGQTLADGFDSALEIIEQIPWSAVGSTFGLMGQGAKVVLDMFKSMPPWVQTAILTGWGLNKLTGGVLGGIVGQLGAGLIKGVLGMNAGVVNLNAAVVNGGVGGAGGVAGAAGRGGLALGITKFLGLGTAVVLGALLGREIGKAIVMPGVQPAIDFETDEFTDATNRNRNDPAGLRAELAAIEQGILDLRGDPGNLPANLLGEFLFGDQIDILEGQKATLESILSELETNGPALESEFRHSRATSDQLLALQQSEVTRANTNRQQMLNALAPLPFGIARLVAKDWAPKVTVNTTVSTNVTVSGTRVLANIVRIGSASGSGPGGALDAGLL